MSPALAGRFLTTGPPGKSLKFYYYSYITDMKTEVYNMPKVTELLSSWEVDKAHVVLIFHSSSLRREEGGSVGIVYYASLYFQGLPRWR